MTEAATAATTLPTVPERLLDAAVEVAADHGLARLSVGDVAKRAGLSRQTLYKHFASKDELVAQAVLREAGRIVEQVIAAAESVEDPVGSLEAAVAEALRAFRGHPLLDRLIATEPEALLPMLIDGSGSVLEAINLIGRQMIGEAFPSLDPARAAFGAELLSRMLISYAVRPSDLPADAVARDLAHAVVAAVLPPSCLHVPPAPEEP
ncbi:MAG: TetR family transcriptional regulator [Acidimicrobiales bacterium]